MTDKKKQTKNEIIQLGERMRQLRKKMGYTNSDFFAYEHNFSRAQYGKYEKGQDIRFSTLVKIIKAYNISIAEFFGEGFD